MTMKPRAVSKWVCILTLAGAAYCANAATLLTFDDLPSDCSIDPAVRVMNGYGGLLWGYRFFLSHDNPIGMVSPTNVAYVDSGMDAYIYSLNLFDLNSAYLTAEN